MLKGFAAVAVALVLPTGEAGALTVRAWAGDTTNFGDEVIDGSAETVNEDGLGRFSYRFGLFAAEAVSGPNFDEGGGGASAFADAGSPVLVNIGAVAQPVRARLIYSGRYVVPKVDDAAATSVASIDISAPGEGSSFARLQHTLVYNEALYPGSGYLSDPLETTTGGGSVDYDLFGTTLFAILETGLILVPPGEGLTKLTMLGTSSINGGSADFGGTGYLSVFVEDKSAFAYDPGIEWIYTFGEAGNRPDAAPDPGRVPLPAGLPLLLTGFAATVALRRRR
jgi:hypothetical protein